LAGLTQAAPAASSAAAPDGPAADREQARIWSDICLARFPDDAKIDAYAAAKGATPMTPEELATYLREEPGRGWTLRTKLSLYAITVERPPYVACSVRRMTPGGLAGDNPMTGLIGDYISAHNGTVLNLPARQSKTPAGADITAWPIGMADAAGRPSDMFSTLLTNYHGRVPDPWQPYAAGGDGVEVRFVHQIAKP
jgi:hypothetical protein